ncbi:MAG: hypothetical protein ACKOET_09610 [Verrucomicrobiota bacterium]
MDSSLTLREAFSRRFRRPPGTFEAWMFARCLKWPVRPLGRLIRALRPRLYLEEYAFLTQAAEARSMAEVRGLVEGWRYEIGVRQRGRSWWFDVVPRPSGRRMLGESRALFESAAKPQPGDRAGQSGKATRAT